MARPARLYAAMGATAALFLLIQLLALALITPFVEAGYQTVEDPSNPVHSLVYVAVVLIATGAMLVVIRLGVEWVLRAVVVLVSGLLSWYVFSVVVPPAVVVSGVHVLAWLLAAGLAVALYVYPEWYVIDAAGVVMGAGGAGLFGVSFGPLPVIVLLVVLAVYDAVSVYRTRHMLTLAESVTDLKLPLLLVVPLSTSYSFLADDAVDTTGVDEGDGGGDEADDGIDRDAFFVGLGDTVMPTILVASAAVFSSAPALSVPGIPGLALTLPALAAMIGTMVGLAALLWLVAKGRAHAGLPLLNGGAIGGYLVGAALAGVPLGDAVGLAAYL